MFDLGPADFDVVAAPEIFLDSGGKPRSRNVELNGTARETPQEGRRSQGRECQDSYDGNSTTPYKALVLRKKMPVAVDRYRRAAAAWTVKGQKP
jgi:hypothetical protein